MKAFALLMLVGCFVLVLALAADEGSSVDDLLEDNYKDMYDEEDNDGTV